MPTVSIQYELDSDVPANGVYSVVGQVLTADNIELEIFVFDVEYMAMIGVASLYGMRNYPRTRDEAIAQGASFFRARGVTRTFDSIEAADEFIAVTKGRIEKLRLDWQEYTDNFVAHEIVTTP